MGVIEESTPNARRPQGPAVALSYVSDQQLAVSAAPVSTSSPAVFPLDHAALEVDHVGEPGLRELPGLVGEEVQVWRRKRDRGRLLATDQVLDDGGREIVAALWNVDGSRNMLVLEGKL